jgi:hypothetical protein
MQKDLFIHSINLVEIEGDFYIPTCVTYDKKGRPIIGRKAQNNPDNSKIAENFKLDIGNINTDEINRDFQNFGNIKKTSIQIASDFFREIL